METQETVLTNIHEHVMTITLNRPKVNAFNLAMIAATQKAFREAARDAQVRAVLLTSSGAVFSAGQDLNELQQAQGKSLRKHLLETYNPLVVQIRRLEKPVLAALPGVAAGAGLGVALACDLRICADNARFVVGFGGIGLVPDSGVSLFLPSLIGIGRAVEFTFNNQPITAEQALAWGLVNRVAPAAQLAQQALAWAVELAHGPLPAMALAKRAFNKAMYPQLEEVLDYEGHMQEIAAQTPEHREGVSAFLEKRAPKYIKSFIQK